jgi:hypothetical protein
MSGGFIADVCGVHCPGLALHLRIRNTSGPPSHIPSDRINTRRKSGPSASRVIASGLISFWQSSPLRACQEISESTAARRMMRDSRNHSMGRSVRG